MKLRDHTGLVTLDGKPASPLTGRTVRAPAVFFRAAVTPLQSSFVCEPLQRFSRCIVKEAMRPPPVQSLSGEPALHGTARRKAPRVRPFKKVAFGSRIAFPESLEEQIRRPG